MHNVGYVFCVVQKIPQKLELTSKYKTGKQ